MNPKEPDKKLKKKLIRVSKEICEIFNTHDLSLDECCAVLGGIFAAFASQTDQNYTFIAFLHSFSNTAKEIHIQQQEEEKINNS